jgi:hypothetical protein
MRQERGGGREGPEVRPGHEIVSEAARLLGQMSFWPNRGAYAQGRYVAISVDPHWEEDHATIQVILTCYAFGHPQVDWQGLPVLARPAGQGVAGQGNVYGMTRLDARGQGRITRLQPDDYRLLVPERYARGEEPLPFGSRSVHGNLAAATEEPDEPFDPQIYASPDESVLATVRRTPDDTTIVAFETSEAALAGAVVYFAFVLASGEILQSATVKLTPVAEEPDLLEARWEAEVEFTELCTFEFGLLPLDPSV